MIRAVLSLAACVLLWCPPASAMGPGGLPGPVASAIQPGAVTAKMVPGSLSLVPGDLVPVELLITNANPSPVTVTSVDVRSPARVMAQKVPSPADIGVVAPNAYARKTFEVRAGRGLEEGDVHVILEVEHAQPGEGPARELVFAQMSVKVGKAAQAIDVSFVSFPSKLNDNQDAPAAVRITNTSAFAFEGLRVRGVRSEDVTLSGDAGRRAGCASDEPDAGLIACVERLAPGEATVVVFDVHAEKRVRTGKQQVAVVVKGSTAATGEALVAEPIATKEIELAVFGVDAISPFGVGTLFVLPGLLAIVAFQMLYRYGYPRGKEVPDTVNFKDPTLMAIILPLSALAYLAVWLWQGADLTSEAGTADVVVLFVIGFLTGLVGWAVLAWVYYRRTDRKRFRLDDSPAKVLERLRARDAGLSLPLVTVDGLQYRYLAEAAGDQMVVCPQITYAFDDSVTDDTRQRYNAARTRGDIETVLGDAEARTVALGWRLPTGVRQVQRSAAQLQQSQPLLVEV